MKKVSTSPDEHLASFPDGIREQMIELDQLISASFAGRSRTVWEGVFWGGSDQHIIGYGDIVQPRPRGEDVEWFAVGLARQKNHFSIYVNAVDDGQYLLAQYKDRLGKAKVGSASIAFTAVDDLDLGALGELLNRANALTFPPG
ncbi:MAG: DUF1801 domain-containing protein [Acidimicrobiia bacterium]